MNMYTEQREAPPPLPVEALKRRLAALESERKKSEGEGGSVDHLAAQIGTLKAQIMSIEHNPTRFSIHTKEADQPTELSPASMNTAEQGIEEDEMEESTSMGKNEPDAEIDDRLLGAAAAEFEKM